MRAYRGARSASAQKIGPLGPSGALVRAVIADSSGLARRTVSAVGWPRDAVLVTIERAGHPIVPRGDLILRTADALTLFATHDAALALEALLASPLKAIEES